MLFSPYCREFNSLQKRYTALLHRTNTFFRKKSYGRWSAEKLTVKFCPAPGVRNRKFYLAPGMRYEKICLAPNDSVEKFYLAVKGLTHLLTVSGTFWVCRQCKLILMFLLTLIYFMYSCMLALTQKLSYFYVEPVV